jgi:hypothetical protein
MLIMHSWFSSRDRMRVRPQNSGRQAQLCSRKPADSFVITIMTCFSYDDGLFFTMEGKASNHCSLSGVIHGGV